MNRRGFLASCLAGAVAGLARCLPMPADDGYRYRIKTPLPEVKRRRLDPEWTVGDHLLAQRGDQGILDAHKWPPVVKTLNEHRFNLLVYGISVFELPTRQLIKQRFRVPLGHEVYGESPGQTALRDVGMLP